MEQVWLYEELVDISATLSDSMKLTLLTNAIHGHTKIVVCIMLPFSWLPALGQAVDFTKYSELLLSECAQEKFCPLPIPPQVW